MSSDEEDRFDDPSSLGLHRILQQVGVDVSTFSSVYDTSDQRNGVSATRALAELDASDDDDAKFMDDVSVSENEDEAEERQVRQAKEEQERQRYIRRALQMQREVRAKPLNAKEIAAEKVKKVWPEWERGQRLKMTEVFYDTPAMQREREMNLAQAKRRKLAHHTYIEYPITSAPANTVTPAESLAAPNLSPLDIPDSDKPLYESRLGAYFNKDWVREARAVRRRQMLHVANQQSHAVGGEAQSVRLLDVIDWESQIILNSAIETPANPTEPLKPRNEHLDSPDWLREIIWDARRISPDLVAVDEDEGVIIPRPRIPAVIGKLDRFNISNDHLYEHSREARFKIRQTFGAIEVFHSAPARCLQLPYYKTSLSKAEQRSWKRPAIQFPIGISLGFTKLRSNPISSSTSRKKAMMTDPSERFKSSKDLTMSEKGPYVLLEFSEEYPPLMSGYGMGTTIVNYYRKNDEKDDHVPKLDIGQPSILNLGDAEPFLLGYVDKGKVTQIIHNNLMRAPIFRHTPETTDFLVIRHTVNGHSSYHIRPIANIYTVGQTFPNESEVPGPHARKNTSYAKIRLQIVAWILIQKAKQKRIKMAKLLKYFPDQTELQMRQRLKIKGQEFLLYNRANGPNQGYWCLNPGYPNPWPNERQEVIHQATPEQAMMFEAMQVGARHLYDAGYTKTAEGKDEEDPGDEAGLDIEQKLAVWSTTLNYKKAEQQKAWLILHGEGDPTGRGEGWNFLTTNMKGYFLRQGETEQGRRLESEHRANGAIIKISNAEQNRIYEEEKRRLWELQASALSNPIPPEEDYASATAATPAGFGPRYSRGDSRRAFSRGNSMANTPFYGESPRDYSPAPSADETSFTGNNHIPKVMRIKRMVRGKLQVEIVRDPQVIASYRRRVEDRKIEEFRTQAEMLAPTGNQEEDELRRAALQQELENMKKNHARRMARKKYTRQATHGIHPEDYDPDLDVGKRRCGACGQMGHTKANRNCPKFNESHPVGQSPIPTPGNGMTPGGMDYFGQGQMTPSENGATPSLKIRFGMGGQK